MPQQEKNVTQKSAAEAAQEAVQAIQNTERKAIDIGQHSVEDIARTATSYNKAAGDFAGLYSGNVHACVECGNKVSAVMRDLGSELMQNGTRAFADISSLSKEALSCNSPEEIMALQAKLGRMVMSNYFEEAARLSAMLFEGYTRAFEPLKERSMSSQEQLQKIMSSWAVEDPKEASRH